MVDPPVLALALDDAPSLRPLTLDALAAVQAVSLRVLTETGVAVGSAAVLARLAAAALRALHVVPHLPDSVPAELDRIVAASAAEAGIA